MSEMVERVARALAASSDIPWDELERKYPGEEMQDSFRRDARAAIEAMREPTDAMLAALIANRPSPMAQDVGLEEQQYADEWREMHRAMTDAALERQPVKLV